MDGLTTIWIFLGIAIIVFSMVAFYAYRLKGTDIKSSAYVQALEAMVESNHRVALEKLKEEARSNSENLNAYLYLGKILRSTGLYKNALKIHLELTYRRNVSVENKRKIYRELIEDYYLMKDWQNVVKLIMANPELMRDKSLIFKVFQAFEELGNWKDAIDFLENTRIKSTEISRRLALYKVLFGQEIAEKKSGHDARLIFKEALKIDSKCAAAYFSIAQTYFEEDRLDDAIEYLKRLALEIPEQSFYAFKPLEETFLEKNEFPKVQSFYQDLIKKFPDVVYPYFALANLFVKKGEIRKAIDLLNNFKSEHPENADGVNKKLFHLLLINGDNKNAIEVAKELIPGVDEGFFHSIVCKKCGFKTNEPTWICPSCREYQSFTV